MQRCNLQGIDSLDAEPAIAIAFYHFNKEVKIYPICAKHYLHLNGLSNWSFTPIPVQDLSVVIFDVLSKVRRVSFIQLTHIVITFNYPTLEAPDYLSTLTSVSGFIRDQIAKKNLVLEFVGGLEFIALPKWKDYNEPTMPNKSGMRKKIETETLEKLDLDWESFDKNGTD